MIVAVIPARGGSKRIPHKNLCEVGGASLISRAVISAIVKGIDVICVTTDDMEIWGAVSGIKSGIPVVLVKRPPELADDRSQLEPAIVHALRCMQEHEPIDWVVLLQPTSPFRTAKHVEGALGVAMDKSWNYDSVLSACEVPGFVWTRHRMSNPVADYDLYSRPRSQDMTWPVRENGAVYVFKPWVLKKGSRLGGKIGIYEMSERDSVEIDTLDDLERANDQVGRLGL